MKTPAPSTRTPDWFADRMNALGPFEGNPHIAIACSGGPDSMALALLADRWARGRGGRATALVVDHGLRPESRQEAATVCGWLAGAGIDAVTLVRQGPPPASDRQAAARRARYALMKAWCRNAGVLHLLLGHHREDQAETLLLRLARGSGVDGLAAMAPLLEAADVRLLRPLLETPRARLAEFLEEEGRPYVRDPSNDDASFARVRMRKAIPALQDEGLSPSRLAATARRMGRARMALERSATQLLARAAVIYPEGYARLAPGPLCDAHEEVGLRALSRLLTCVGGSDYGPRLERLERLYAWLRNGRSAGSGRTLGGCRILWRGNGILVCREAAATRGSVAAVDGAVWDARFRLALGERAAPGLRFGQLGRAGWEQLVRSRPALRKTVLPAPVRAALPALWALDAVVAVPHLNYRRKPDPADDSAVAEAAFVPARPLSVAGFVSAADFR